MAASAVPGGPPEPPGPAAPAGPSRPLGMGRRLATSIRRSLALKLAVLSGLMLLACVAILSIASIRYQQAHAMEEASVGADRLSTTIKLGAHYAMLINSRGDINRIIRNVARQKDIVHVRIYNKAGAIKFTNIDSDVDRITDIKSRACIVCHQTEPPRTTLELAERTRIFTAPDGQRVLGILSPIYNEPACSADPCHFHPPEKKVLGALDVAMTLAGAEGEILSYQRKVGLLAALVYLAATAGSTLVLWRFVRLPVARLIEGTQRIGRGFGFEAVKVRQNDEIGELAEALNKMAEDIAATQAEVYNQRDEYQQLFAQVPCYVTVQDRGFKLLRYNRQFGEKFHPAEGEHCFSAYKGRLEKCPDCPVERTFATGKVQISEESGFNKDGTRAHWIVHSSPILDAKGQVVAAMEMCLDITERKELEEKFRDTQRKYAAVFENIPHSVFVLDLKTLEILDCNPAALKTYGYAREELIGRCFLDLFIPEERQQYASQLRAFTVLGRARTQARDGHGFFVDIMLSAADYPDRQVLLLTATDITQRLEAEQKVIQAGKMATLGEMATGVAHELNQPLTVIKTAASFFRRKVDKGETIDPQVMAAMAREVDGYVDRASEIIGHLREFGRKADLRLEDVDLNAVLRRSFELFSRQLSLRQIEVEFDLDPQLPHVLATANKLEQVFINLLLNARDAIEERAESDPEAPRRIAIRSRLAPGREQGRVQVRVQDTGKGIPPAIRSRIFEPFFTTKKVGKGTGLGLSISYGLVKDFGGTIQAVEPDDGLDGAAFELSFTPLSGPAQPPQASEELP